MIPSYNTQDTTLRPSPNPQACKLPDFPSLNAAFDYVATTVHSLLDSPQHHLYQPDASAWHKPGPPCRVSLAGLFAARHFGFPPNVKLQPAQFPNRTETFLNALDLLAPQEIALACKLLHITVYHEDLCEGDIDHYWSQRYVQAQVRLAPVFAAYNAYASFQELRSLTHALDALTHYFIPGAGRKQPAKRTAA